MQSNERQGSILKSYLRRTSAALLVAAFAHTSLVAGPALATEFKVGGIGIVTPTYEGSDRYKVIGAPFIFPVFSDGPSNGAFTVNGLDDVRLRLFNEQGFQAGATVGYTFGREEDDGPLLRGLGDVDAGFVAGAFIGYQIHSVLFDMSYHRIVSGDDTGGYLRVGLTNQYNITDQLRLKTRVGTTYADGDYMRAYFGVSAAQSEASVAELDIYETDPGFKDIHLNLSATYDIDANWALMAGAGYKRLIGDAADSPIVETANQFSATLGVTYKFSFR